MNELKLGRRGGGKIARMPHQSGFSKTKKRKLRRWELECAAIMDVENEERCQV